MLSVIVAVYNVEKYIRKTIESIIHQTYPDMEIILVDDGSTDQSRVICDEFAKEDLRVKVIHKKNGGLSDARNAGIDASNGEYLAFIDGDDYIHPEMFEILMKNLLETESDISACSFLTVEEDATPKVELQEQKLEIYSGNEALHQLYRLEITVAWNKIYKKKIFEELRYPKGKLHEDEYLIHHILDRCQRIVLTNYKLYFYLIRQGSIMNTLNLQRIEDTMDALFDRYRFFSEKNDLLQCKATGDDMINSLIMYEKNAICNKDNRRKQIHKIVKRYMKGIILEQNYQYSSEYGLEARIYFVSPRACLAWRWIKDKSNRTKNKLHRMLHEAV